MFGAAYVVTVALRGERPTLRGALTVLGSALAVLATWSLAVSAPAWALVWTAAAVLGVVCGLVRPLPHARRG